MRVNIKHDLNLGDIYFILESLSYTQRAFREYPVGGHPRGYPNHEFKCQRLKEVNDIIAKVRKIRDELKHRSKP